MFADAEYEIEFYWPPKLGTFNRRMLIPGVAVLVSLFGVMPAYLAWFNVRHGLAIDIEFVAGCAMFATLTAAVAYVGYVHWTVRHAFLERCWLGSRGLRVRHANGLETNLTWSECSHARSSLIGQCVMVYSPRLQAPAVVLAEMWVNAHSIPMRIEREAGTGLAIARMIVSEKMNGRYSRTL